MLSTELAPNGGYLVAEERAGVPGPRIVMLVADHDTQNALAAWAEAAGFDQAYGGRAITPDMFDFHITLLATADAVSIPETDHLIEPVAVEAVSFDALGPDKDTPVLSLSKDGLQLLRDYFIETYGAEPIYTDFKPHVSLSYAWDGEPALEDLELPDFPLVFDRLVVKPFEQKDVPVPSHDRLARLIAELEAA